jgi:hypothetical protein
MSINPTRVLPKQKNSLWQSLKHLALKLALNLLILIYYANKIINIGILMLMVGYGSDR